MQSYTRFLLLIIFLAHAVHGAEQKRSSSTSENYAAFYDVAVAVNTFGSRLLLEYRKEHTNSSVVFSPVSLTLAFFLLYKGSAGETQKELEKVFEFNVPLYSKTHTF